MHVGQVTVNVPLLVNVVTRLWGGSGGLGGGGLGGDGGDGGDGGGDGGFGGGAQKMGDW